MNASYKSLQRTLIRIATFILTYIVCAIFLSLIIDRYIDLKDEFALYISIVATGIISIALAHVFDHKVVREGFSVNMASTQCAMGFCLATGLIGLGSLLIYLTGNIQWLSSTTGMTSLAAMVLFFAWIAFYEELLFRGVVMKQLMRSTNQWTALIISAGIFALFHSLNPNTGFIAILNIFLGGILIGGCYLHQRSLWLPFSFHFAWNFVQGPILGYEVSGMDFPALLTQQLSGSDMLTGGQFGFEGSIIQTVVVLIGIIILLPSVPKTNSL